MMWESSYMFNILIEPTEVARLKAIHIYTVYPPLVLQSVIMCNLLYLMSAHSTWGSEADHCSVSELHIESKTNLKMKQHHI